MGLSLKTSSGPWASRCSTFSDSTGSNRVGLIAEIPDLEAFEAFMQTGEAAAAMKHDGVHPETLLVLREA